MLEPAEHHGRQQAQRLAEGLRHQEGDDGDFGDVELEIAHHALERGVRHLDVGEVEFDEVAPQRAAAQGVADRVITEQCL